MAYDTTHITTLSHLKALAEKAETTYAKETDLDSLESTVTSLEETVEGIVSTGGEANVIESISVNGTAQTITNKNVDITVPTATSDLTNDSGYQTESEVSEAIATAISESGHASYQVADSVPTASEAEENILYLVMNSDTGYYDIYALVSGSVVLLDDTSVDLTDYVTATALTSALASYVTTTALTSTLSSYVTTTALTSALEDYIADSEIASDEEVEEMLEEVFA